MEVLEGVEHVEPMHVNNGCVDAQLIPAKDLSFKPQNRKIESQFTS